MNRISFEPTYKELKRFLAADGKTAYPSFEPTYKELKPSSFPIAKPYSFAFRAYLQGIETALVRVELEVVFPSFEPTYKELKLASSKCS